MTAEIHRRFTGKVALVTGGGTGIGAAIAAQLAAEGAAVALIGRRGHVVQKQADALRSSGYNALPIRGDVAVEAPNLVRQVIQHFGRLDVLVNNAAISAGLDLDEMTMEMWRQVLAINLDAAFSLVQAARPHLIDTRGCVLHISSIGVVVGEFDDIAYVTSKAALEAFSRRLAIELAPYGIRSNVIRPGLIHTAAFDAMPAEFFEAQLPLIPLGRIGAPEDIARAAAFLCSDDAAFITGAVLTVDGGESAK
ncbi:MAG TPA: SDR family oxidoreductase [Chloroflexi bacterium]|nr:SDR family oxidoreductase [Chloroflexota bacterium]